MPSRFSNKQKSPAKRFLPILRAVVFFAAGITLIFFWDDALPGYGYKKTLFGCLLIVYSIVRFALLLRKEKVENDEE
jgi:membrane protein DedA with SNARE-associated domain